jgi:uncharacterized protein YjbI with pentapeptide repeats
MPAGPQSAATKMASPQPEALAEPRHWKSASASGSVSIQLISIQSKVFCFSFRTFSKKEMVAMRMILSTSLLGSMLLSCVFFTPVVAQEATKEKPRVYKHDFEGQDLSDRDFSKQNLDDANFGDAVLKNTKFERASLKNCNFQGAKLEGTNLSYADLTGSDFRKSSFSWPSIYQAIFNGADLSGIDLNGLNTSEMKFREAKLRGTKGFNQIYGTDYYKADLRGADFSTAVLLDRTNFRKAKVDQYTRWPKGFDVKDQGLEFVETKPEEKDGPKTKSTTGNEKSEAEFKKLDRNEDGVLSGTEMKWLQERDANGDGEISMSEFLGKGR